MDWFFYVLGMAGALLTSTSWIPQIVKGIRTRQLRDISTAMLVVFGCGTFCWLIYGVGLGDWIIIGANAWAFSNIVLLLTLKLWFRAAPAEPNQAG